MALNSTSSELQIENEVYTTSGGNDSYLIKYTASGELEWIKKIASNKNDKITKIASDGNGNFVISGYYSGSEIKIGSTICKNKGAIDGFIAKYTENGDSIWVKNIFNNTVGLTAANMISAISIDNNGDIYIGGSYNNCALKIDNYSLVEAVSSEGYVAKLDKNGRTKWAKSYSEGVPGSYMVTTGVSTRILDVSATNDNGVVVVTSGLAAGRQIGNVLLDSKGREDANVIKYSSAGSVDWATTFGGENNDYITSVFQFEDGTYMFAGWFVSKTIEVGDKVIQNIDEGDGVLARILIKDGVSDTQSIEVKNDLKEFHITTYVEEVNGIKGGSISGEEADPYEIVQYDLNSEKEIKMIPNEGYEIIKVTINGEEIDVNSDEDGSYILPNFVNVTEDKEVIVTYANANNKITINKVNNETNEPLEGVEFELKQIEERNKPEAELGEIVDNGVETQEYVKGNTIIDSLTEYISNGQYYFTEVDGVYVPTNGKTYQLANGGKAGIASKVANSYIKLDLTDYEGRYVINLNARISSESSLDIGYATITKSTSAPAYYSSDGQFMKISGTVSDKDYISKVLDGGEIYYLHLGYSKNASNDVGQDQLIINSISLHEAVSEINSYNFIEEDGKYI